MSLLSAVECYPCREVSSNYSDSLLFHGGDTGSTPVRDANTSITYEILPFRTLSMCAAAEFLPGSLLRHKLITMSAHGEKMPRLLGVVFQLLPQPAHVNINGAGQHSRVIAPNLAQ
jgi:hypothetical protein